MKKIFLFIFFICSYITVNACGPFYRTCSPKDFCIFRICGDNVTGQFNWDNYDRNCEEWAKLTSQNIPLADIKEVVYKWDIQQIQSIKNRATGTKTPNNAFAKWLIRHNDTEIIDFLLLAKANEQIGSKQCSVWYYYVDDDDECIQLKELIAKAKEYKGTRLKDRYMLQIIRALFRCHNYDELVNVWHNNKEIFKDGVIKEMTAEYVAGAYHHIYMGDEEQERQALIDNGLGSLIYKQTGDIDDYFTAIYEHNPDDPCLFLSLQAHHHCFSEDWYERITAIIKEHKSKEMAKWLYVGAYIADELNKPQEALSYILQAEKCVKDKDTGDAVRLLKLYLKTKTASCYDQSFETYLYNELVWLDKKISENLTDQVKAKTIEDGLYYNLYGFRYYYWNDMLRKIIIGELVPLCIKSNYITRALQYLNMADNDLFNKIGKVGIDRVWEDTTFTIVSMSLKSYRNSTTHTNDYDYMNDFFINLDTFDVKYTKRLVDRINHPLDNLDKFLNKNSYTDSQFFYDIIGTKLIASMKYKEAIKYLSLVSNNFQKSRNVYEFFDRDPFKNGKIGSYDCQYKLHFAQKMYSLEQKIKTSKNPNNKAEYMLEYARGLQSSFIRCWALTSYYKGKYFEGANIRAERANNATIKVKEIKQTAFALFTDDERAARAYADWDMFKTAATLYPETQTAKEIHGHCDILVDYQIEKWWI